MHSVEKTVYNYVQLPTLAWAACGILPGRIFHYWTAPPQRYITTNWALSESSRANHSRRVMFQKPGSVHDSEIGPSRRSTSE